MTNNVPISALELNVDFHAAGFDCGLKPLNKFATKELLKKKRRSQAQSIYCHGWRSPGWVHYIYRKAD